jgi:predicted alpha/beta hydrolase family esterase
MRPILIVPGLGNSGPGHWQSHWQQRLGATRVLPRDWNHPDRADWTHAIAAAVWRHPGAILIAHSLGVAAIAHAAQDNPRINIAGALLVAPADADSGLHTPDSCRPFASIPLRRFPFPTIVVASRNDPTVTLDRARVFAHAWGSEMVDAGEAGHLNVESGHGPWPEGLCYVARLLRDADGARSVAA